MNSGYAQIPAEASFARGEHDAPVVLISRSLTLSITLVSTVVLARLLCPADYGVMAMVMGMTGLLSAFSDFGLSLVTIQRDRISSEQVSTLFWINLSLGGMLGCVAAAMAPLIVWFYGDERLLWPAFALSAAFPLDAVGVQHAAILKRGMRFGRLTAVRLIGAGVGVVTALALAVHGAGCWALVAQVLAGSLGASLAVWILVPWRPARPGRCAELKAMLGFGGGITAQSITGYLASHLDKLLLGRYGGAAVLGIYALSEKLMLQMVLLTGYCVGEAAIPALSRVSGDREKTRVLCGHNLRWAYGVGIPACIAGVLWSQDVVLTLMGPRWESAAWFTRCFFVAAIARLLSVSTNWVCIASGRVRRMLRWELFSSGVMILATCVGIRHGAAALAAACMITQWGLLLPCLSWCFRGTGMTWGDALRPALFPAGCGMMACVLATAFQEALMPGMSGGAVRMLVRSIAAVILYGTAYYLVETGTDHIRRYRAAVLSPACPNL